MRHEIGKYSKLDGDRVDGCLGNGRLRSRYGIQPGVGWGVRSFESLVLVPPKKGGSIQQGSPTRMPGF